MNQAPRHFRNLQARIDALAGPADAVQGRTCQLVVMTTDAKIRDGLAGVDAALCDLKQAILTASQAFDALNALFPNEDRATS